jgi:hypothetical protein
MAKIYMVRLTMLLIFGDRKFDTISGVNAAELIIRVEIIDLSCHGTTDIAAVG